jgi:hypothetical protein
VDLTAHISAPDALQPTGGRLYARALYPGEHGAYLYPWQTQPRDRH